jgi:hypothetical protein
VPSPTFGFWCVAMASWHSRSFSFSRLIVLCAVAGFPAFSQPARTPSELMQQVFDALEHKDVQRLKALAISKPDFKKFIWPNLRRTVVAKLGITAQDFYSLTVKESDIGLGSTLKEFGGRKWLLVQIEPLTAEHHRIRRTRFTSYSGPGVNLRDAEGNERTANVVGGIVELGGVFKVSTYSLSPDQKQ